MILGVLRVISKPRMFVLCWVLLAICFPVSNVRSAQVDTLFMATSRLRGFDPVRAGDVASAKGMGKIYEGLLQYSYTARPYKLEPALAAAMPKISADGLVYTIQIKTNVFFHDDRCFPASQGRQLEAKDFVYSIKRVADTRNSSTGFWAFRGRILGLDEFHEKTKTGKDIDYDEPIDGLRATDKYTLQIKLKKPYPQLLWILAMPYGYAIPREAVEFYGNDFANHPVGTGPYVLHSWRRNYRLEYLRNSCWHGGIPMPERLVEYVISDPSTSWLMFMSGQLALYNDISRDNWDVVVSTDGKLGTTFEQAGIQLHATPGLATYYIGFNMDDPLVGRNRALRQALSCAFDSASWSHYHQGRVKIAKGPIPPNISGYDKTLDLYAFDLMRARALLKEAGFPEGINPATGKRLRLTLELGKTNTEIRESTELLISFMKKIGVEIIPSYNSKPIFFEKIEKRQAQMFRLSWFADYPDAENFLQLFYGPNDSPGPNRTNYRNPQFDRLYEKARTMQDSDERTKLYAEMAALVMADAPWICMHHPIDYTLSHSKLKNYAPHDFPYGMEKHYRLENK